MRQCFSGDGLARTLALASTRSHPWDHSWALSGVTHRGSQHPLLSAGAGGECGFIPRGETQPKALQSSRKKDK